MKHSTEDIIAENKRRLALNDWSCYDPLVGYEHTPHMHRVALDIKDAPIPHQLIPEEMDGDNVITLARKCKTLSKAGAAVFGGKPSEKKAMEVWRQLQKTRCKYDFEFYCVTQCVITDKQTGTLIPFVLNRPQATIYLPALELLRKQGKPIDVIVCKARQWGGSTLSEFYMKWIADNWRTNWNCVVCADVDDQARIVLGMLIRAAESYDTFISNGVKQEFRPYMGATSTRVLSGRDCTFSVGSAQHPDKIRCQNLSAAHLTEVGLWKETKGKKPEDVVQSIFGTINSGAYTLKILESTAKGVGNFFHRTWLGAIDKKSEFRNNFTPVFVAWWQIDLYSTRVDNYEEFIRTLTKYELWLFSIGATLEAIAWYRKKSEEFLEHWRMCSEFPSTWEEAFQSTGNNFYPIEYVDELAKGCTAPLFVGEVSGNEPKGKNALVDVRVFEQSNGNLKVWLDIDDKPKMNDRYLVVVDIGGRGDKSDRSVICVFDRYWMHEVGGIPEVAAEWCGHIEHDLLAWKAAQIATYYDNALLVVESNTLETKGTEGNHFNTLLSEIAEVYDNIYRRTKDEQLVKGGIVRYGFHTNTATKPMVCDFELEVLRDGLYIERCLEAVNEHRTFEIKPNGSLGAVEGNHDDRHITRAIGNYFNYKVMSVPTFANQSADSRAYSKKIINEFTL